MNRSISQFKFHTRIIFLEASHYQFLFSKFHSIEIEGERVSSSQNERTFGGGAGGENEKRGTRGGGGGGGGEKKKRGERGGGGGVKTREF